MRLAASILCAAIALPLAAAEVVWVEGENPSRGQGYPHNWYSDAVQKGALSGNAFLSSFTDTADTEVDYDLTIPADGEYTLWARVNTIQAAVSWRQGGGAWQAVDLSKAVDNVNIANDGKPDLRFLAWVKVGKLPLKAGTTAIGFKLHSANNHHGALDCFVLTTGPFLPSGKNQPGGAKPAAGFDAASYVWIEGEEARDSDFKPHNWYSDMVKKDSLSGGNWLSTFDGPAGATGTWDVAIPKDGTWTLWLRANPIQAGLDWRLDDGAWQAADVSRPQDNLNIASDGKPDLRFVAWLQAGKAEVKAGKHRLQIRTTATLSNHAGIDVVLFAAKPFAPNGKARPGAALGEADPGWFAFEPGVDEFRTDALLDLRSLNEKRAGEKGWLKAAGRSGCGRSTPAATRARTRPTTSSPDWPKPVSIWRASTAWSPTAAARIRWRCRRRRSTTCTSTSRRRPTRACTCIFRPSSRCGCSSRTAMASLEPPSARTPSRCCCSSRASRPCTRPGPRPY